MAADAGLLGDVFGLNMTETNSYVAPKQVRYLIFFLLLSCMTIKLRLYMSSLKQIGLASSK